MTEVKAPRIFTPLKHAISNMRIQIQAAKSVGRGTVVSTIPDMEVLLDQLKGAETEYAIRHIESQRMVGSPFRDRNTALDYLTEGEEIVERLVLPWAVQK